MTYKSIVAKISELINAGKLIDYEAVQDVDEGVVRRILLMPELHSHLYEKSLLRSEKDYRTNIRSNLSDFVAGAEIYYGHDMWCLDPRDRYLWEMKITMLPQTRLLGGIAYQNCFVCTNWDFRNDLGRKGSKEWRAAEKEAIKNWDKLFPNWGRCPCWPLSNCITEAHDE